MIVGRYWQSTFSVFISTFRYSKLVEAAEVYRAILAESPTDLLACLLAFFKYYELGMFKEMLDMMKSVVKGYTPETPGYR